MFFVALMIGLPLLLGFIVARLAFGQPIPILPLLLGPLGLYISSRFSVLLPARAIGQPLSLSEAWSLTRGSGLKIMALTYVLPVAAGLFVARQEVSNIGYYLILLLMGVVLFLAPFILLSLAYSELSRPESNQV